VNKPLHSHKQLHNRAVLLLLLLVRPTKTFPLHLDLTPTLFKFFKTLLGFGEFIRCCTLAISPVSQFTEIMTYRQPDHTTSSPRPNSVGSLYPLR
jgi:hypothetical protein